MATVVITGGSRGIGAAAVELFAARGDTVCFFYARNEAAARTIAEKTGATAIRCDVSDQLWDDYERGLYFMTPQFVVVAEKMVRTDSDPFGSLNEIHNKSK